MLKGAILAAVVIGFSVPAFALSPPGIDKNQSGNAALVSADITLTTTEGTVTPSPKSQQEQKVDKTIDTPPASIIPQFS